MVMMAMMGYCWSSQDFGDDDCNVHDGGANGGRMDGNNDCSLECV